jgi:two-component system alkaline phosphatase synthesis response regulator PhoP
MAKIVGKIKDIRKGRGRMIYCIEGDDALRELMLYTLRGAGFAARGVASGEALAAALRAERPALLLLDTGGLPDAPSPSPELPKADNNGLELLRRLRGAAATARLPVILLSARGSEYDKVTGLDAGADDYLVKPFGMMELLARVRAVLRRAQSEQEAAAPKPLRAGDLTLDPAEHLVQAGGRRLRLTLKEYELLRAFLQHPGRVFTRDALLARVWGMDYVGESRTVDVHIGTLRAKLRASSVRIETVRGVGYRLDAEP